MVKVNLIGFDSLAKRIEKAPVKLKKEIGQEIQLAGERLAELAVKSLSSGVLTKPTGQLAGSIRPQRTGELSTSVTVHKHYAPYVEWGTITKVRVPSELSAYAMQFKGRGLRKNGGMAPRPFFFMHVPQVRKETIVRIENILEDIV